MVISKYFVTTAALAALCTAAMSQAATVPFTEDFAADNANWKDAAGVDLAFLAAGGPDGSGYVSGTFSFAASNENDPATLLRGQDNFDSSGDAFVGDWVSGGVTEFTAWVRHDAPFPLPMFTRFATPVNFPGAAGIQFAPVLPNTWTRLTIAINPASPQIVYEGPGSNFNSVFGNVGNLQIGVQVPAGLAGFTPLVTIDLDQPTITPEPASAGLFAVGALVMMRRRR
jgi:hypothetical protein